MLFLLPNFNLIRDCLGFFLFNVICLWLFIEKHHCHGDRRQTHIVSGRESPCHPQTSVTQVPKEEKGRFTTEEH